MPIPDYQAIMLPLLTYAADGKELGLGPLIVLTLLIRALPRRRR